METKDDIELDNKCDCDFCGKPVKIKNLYLLWDWHVCKKCFNHIIN